MTTLPNKERLLLWVEALESGNYQQGFGHLMSPGDPQIADGRPTYCCLGVAAVVAKNNGAAIRCSMDIDGYATFDGNSGYLSTNISSWYGLTEVDPILDFPDGTKSAVDANDSELSSFDDIAAAIRRTYHLGLKP